MKNHEHIRQLPVEELAKLLVNDTQVDEGDAWEDEVCMCTYYESSVLDGLWMEYNDALKETIDWLNAEMEIINR